MREYQLKSFQPPIDLQINYQAELNLEQYQVVTGAEGPCLVLAGAGSGKTRVLVYRVAYLLERGVSPERIMLVTFTNKAAKEMMSRIEKILKEKTRGLWGGTFHHLGNRLLRQYGQAIGLKPNFNILDEEDANNLLKTCLKEIKIPTDKYFPKTKVIRKIISLATNSGQDTKSVMATRFSQIPLIYSALIESLAQNYQVKKIKSNALDFDDLLYYWLKLLLTSETVRNKLAEQFQYILVDEYQDTNPLQGKIIENLVGAGKNILVVGDDAQSIYSFRGADISNILDFPKVFPNCQTFKLETNYRSTPEILGLANQSIKNNREQFKKELKTNKASAGKPILTAAADAEQQAEFVSQRILELNQESGIGLNQIAVLFRAHYQSLELELAFNKKNIPYVMRGGLRFFEQAHIKDALAFLKIIANSADEISWQRVLFLFDGLGEASAQKIWQRISRASDLKAVLTAGWADGLTGRLNLAWQRVQNLFKKLTTIDPNNIAELLETIISSDYDVYLKNNYENYNDRLSDLKQLAIFSANYEKLQNFLADAALSEGFKGEVNKSQPMTDKEMVTLSTIHQAKGLEWRVVFIIGLVDGQFPNIKVLASPAEMAEERRLFYVAATRAQDELYLTYPLIGGYLGVFNQLSQFVKELPEQFYDSWQVKEESCLDSFSIDEPVIQLNEEGEVSNNFWQRFIAKRQQREKDLE